MRKPRTGRNLRNTNEMLDGFIKNTALLLGIPEATVELIIKDQWKHANLASRSLREVEVKDIGIFYLSPRKVATRIVKLNSMLPYLKKQESVESVNNQLLMLKTTKYYDRTERYLAKQGSDTGGDIKQDISKGGSGADSHGED